ncbi:MAG: prepilin peptidase [Clostridia bacterium]|nr:prepilin peptidase [Clostridia bacterium]
MIDSWICLILGIGLSGGLFLYEKKKNGGPDSVFGTVCPVLFSSLSVFGRLSGGAALSLPVLGCVLGYAAMEDKRTHLIPDLVHILLLLISLPLWDMVPLPSRLLGGILLGLIALVSSLLDGERGLGGGDIKGIAALSFLLGLKGGLAALLVSFSLVGLSYLAERVFFRKKREEAVPLMPYLAAGAFFGTALLVFPF